MEQEQARADKLREIKQLYTNPNMHLEYSMDEIYSFMNAFSSEIELKDEGRYKDVDFVSVLPPLYYENKFIKGVCYTQAPDLLCKIFPSVKSLFHVASVSMYSNFARQSSGDALFSLYKNEEREEWFRRKYPNRKDAIFIPLEDSDFTHEYVMMPRNQEKIYDIIMVSRISEDKNLALVAEALKIYREKYKKDLKVLWIVGKEFDSKLQGLDEAEQEMLGEMSKHFIDASYQYIKIVTYVDYNKMPNYYSQSKVCLLASLIEGKNRSIREAMACDTPILMFKDFLKYVRGQEDIIPNFSENAGHLVETFNAEALAQGIEYMLENLGKFTPRKTYLESMGRRNFFNILLDSFPYYLENIPKYEQNNAFNNKWLDLAMVNNYMVSLNDYLYSRNLNLQASRGAEQMKNLLEFYANKYKNFIK